MTFNFIKMSQIVIIFFAVSEVTIYSVSVEDNEISICFVKHQNTDLLAILIRNSIINFLSCKFAS